MSEPPPSSSLPPQPPSSAEPPQSSSEAPVVPKLEPETSDPSALDAPAADMANNTTAANAEAGAGPADAAAENPAQAVVSSDTAATSKKETSLREFLGKMDEYAPIIPDAVTSHYLTLAGLPPPGNGPNQTPPHLARLLALATQKFIADIAADSYQYARIRASNSTSASNPMGSLNAASGLGVPGAGGAGGGAAGGGGAGDAGKGGGANKGGAHLGIQRAGFGGGGSGGSGQGRTVLTMEDLGMAVSEYGVSVKRGEFYR
ncbi:transcription initiation factor TFIID 23-30kDa subunit-domain-containing protein [Aspergillus pseudodeflectus]|uniref:Transcription initiation factor TFIID subunit 10 n=1 Tax=Aspergillus pseudodeflectus TaxID=176178 RepID=A0ABR4KMZ9_9EURO